MKFIVELLAFGNGETREVYVPDEELSDCEDYDTSILELIFHYGQNYSQAQNLPSVSAGDIILLPNGNCKWLIRAVGYSNLSDEEYEDYKKLDMSQRVMESLSPDKNVHEK